MLSQYISQLSLDIRWKARKHGIIPDALSRLLRDGYSEDDPKGDGILEEVATYHATLLEIAPPFWKKPVEACKADETWVKFFEMLRNGGPGRHD